MEANASFLNRKSVSVHLYGVCVAVFVLRLFDALLFLMLCQCADVTAAPCVSRSRTWTGTGCWPRRWSHRSFRPFRAPTTSATLTTSSPRRLPCWRRPGSRGCSTQKSRTCSRTSTTLPTGVSSRPLPHPSTSVGTVKQQSSTTNDWRRIILTPPPDPRSLLTSVPNSGTRGSSVAAVPYRRPAPKTRPPVFLSTWRTFYKKSETAAGVKDLCPPACARTHTRCRTTENVFEMNSWDDGITTIIYIQRHRLPNCIDFHSYFFIPLSRLLIGSLWKTSLCRRRCWSPCKVWHFLPQSMWKSWCPPTPLLTQPQQTLWLLLLLLLPDLNLN